MTREQRLVTAAFATLIAIVVFALAGRVTATPPAPHLGHISERLFSDVPAPLGASQVRVPSAPSAAQRGGIAAAEGLRGASEHRAGAPLPARVAVPFSASASRATDAAVRGAAQTPPTAQPSAAIRKEVGAQPVRFVTWYADPSLGPDGLYAAAGDWHWGDDPYLVVLTRIADGRTYSVTLIVQDACSACRDGSPILDISPAGFRALGAPLSAGVVRVEVTRP